MKSYVLNGQKIPVTSLETALYVVATPIGNLKDITLRALETLASVDMIACEDTRHSGRLLNHYGIKNELISYHDHNGDAMRPVIIDALRNGKSIALITDAGTPLIADPGFKLVREITKEGFKAIPIAGASAIITALSSAGLPTDSFFFDGFLPPKQAARRARLESLKGLKATLVFYETAGRIDEVLTDALFALGDREVVLARELTKLYEEFQRGTLSSLLAQKREDRGEMVLMIGAALEVVIDENDIDRLLQEALAKVSVKESAELVALQTGLSKRDLYQRALALK